LGLLARESGGSGQTVSLAVGIAVGIAGPIGTAPELNLGLPAPPRLVAVLALYKNVMDGLGAGSRPVGGDGSGSHGVPVLAKRPFRVYLTLGVVHVKLPHELSVAPLVRPPPHRQRIAPVFK
jgi:hypothetical protein